jgi:hypothetical protein
VEVCREDEVEVVTRQNGEWSEERRVQCRRKRNNIFVITRKVNAVVMKRRRQEDGDEEVEMPISFCRKRERGIGIW